MTYYSVPRIRYGMPGLGLPGEKDDLRDPPPPIDREIDRQRAKANAAQFLDAANFQMRKENLERFVRPFP